MGLTDDFNVCQIRARNLAEQLYNSSYSPEICFGSYHPTTPVNTWDDRWQELYRHHDYEMGFLHFWVECNNYILDVSAQQFGLSPIMVYQIPNKQYYKFGYEDIITKTKIQFPNTPTVIWNAHPEYANLHLHDLL